MEKYVSKQNVSETLPPPADGGDFGVSDDGKELSSGINIKFVPDFVVWRAKLFIYSVGLALFVIACEIAGVIFCAVNGREFDYLTQLILPSGINALILIAERFVISMKNVRAAALNALSVLVISAILITASAFHYSVCNIVTALCVPVLVSVVFCSRGITLAVLFCSLAGVGISAVTRYVSGYVEGLFTEIVAAAAAVVFAEIAAQIMIVMINEQRIKLTEIADEAVRSRHEAIHASRAKSDYLANMSHEIRTPINAILGMNEMILREEHRTAIRDYALSIQSSGNLLLSLINDVLDISKIESGQVEIVPTVYDVSSLINDCYNMSASRAAKKGLELKVECDEELPHLLRGDELRIRQIIVNLMTNGIKYTEKGTVTLSITGAKKDGVFFLKVAVSDTGIGISEDNLNNLFHQFKRLDLIHNRNIEGTGLGLTIVKHLLELMSGEINVESKLKEGSTFSIEIPQEVVEDSPVGLINLSYAQTDDYSYTHSFEAPDAHILAVDDLYVNLLVIKNMLKETKVQIDTAMSGAEAIELCEKNKYDLILMDHMMPQMDGVEAYGKLRADEKTLNSQTPVIMLTANALAGIREKYMNVGFADYLSKPVRGKTLEETIKKYLPPELVTVNEEKSEEQQYSDSSDKNVLTPLVELLPQINLNIALQYCCGSVEFYIEVLKTYGLSRRYQEMQEQIKNEDFEGYRVNAHSLKSTSMTIGLEGLSERARASELAIKNGDIGYVKMVHDELMEMYADVLDKIRLFLNKFPNE